MIRFQHGSAEALLRFTFPVGWDPSLLTAVTLDAYNQIGGAQLITAQEMTIHQPMTLDGAVARYSDHLVLNATDDGEEEPEEVPITLTRGDQIRIVGAAGVETKILESYDQAAYTAHLETIVENQYDDGSAVLALFATAELDLGDDDDFPRGTKLTLVLTPTGTGEPFTIEAEIMSYHQLDVADFELEFSALFPRVFDGLTKPTNRLPIVLKRAQDQLRDELLTYSPRFDIRWIRDGALLKPPLMALCAMNWALNGDDDLSFELKGYKAEYDRAISVLTHLNDIWLDPNENLAINTGNADESGEIGAPFHLYEPGW